MLANNVINYGNIYIVKYIWIKLKLLKGMFFQLRGEL